MNPLFLIDPNLIRSIDDVIRLESQFGISQTGRLLGLNPSDYVKLIYENVSLKGHSERKRSAFDEAIFGIKQYSVKGKFSDNPGMSWRNSSNKSKRDGIVDHVVNHDEYDDIDDLELDLKKRSDWSVLADPTVSNFANELKNIFIYSKSLIIVDQYFFDRDRRFDVLKKLIEVGSKSQKCKSIDIVVSLSKYYDEYDEKTGVNARKYATKFNENHSYTKVKYVIANDQGNPRLFHQRCILSNLGGLRLEHGLAVPHSGLEEIECLDLKMHEQKWNLYRNIGAEVSGSIEIPLNY